MAEEEAEVKDPEVEEVKDEEEEDPEGDKESDEDEESDEEKDDEEDKEDEEPELTRVNYNEIKEKYPAFFKDFPTLKHSFFREQQFTEVFPTVEDAKRAAEAQSAYEEIAEAVISGDTSKFLNELRNENPEALEKFSSNFLPALKDINKDAYFSIVGPTVRQFVRDVYAHGANEKDDNIRNAAKIVHKILFGGSYEDVEKDSGGTFQSNGRRDETVDRDRQSYFSGKYQNLYKEVTNDCYGKLEEEINKGLSDLDKVNKGLKRLIFSDVRSKVLEDMDKDSAYLGRMKSLWLREKRTGFSGQLKNSFQTTFMAKAKTLIAKHRAESRKEAKIEAGKDIKGSTRITGGKESKTKGKAMTSERQRTEKLTTRQVFDD